MEYLEIKNLKKDFSSSNGAVEVLKDVSFFVKKGETVSVIGPSGGGKTTLLRCINFLENTDGGTMILDGETLICGDKPTRSNEKDLQKKRLNFGMVFQQYNLFPHCTVRENIELAPLIHIKEEFAEYKKSGAKTASFNKYFKKRKAEIFEETTRLLQKVGLSEKENDYPCSLSGGQEQRVSIARALAMKPKVLCFDEPTSALDPALTGKVEQIINDLKNDGTTMIIVTHDMEFSKNVSDRVIFMQNGAVVESGTPKEIFEEPKTLALKVFLNTEQNGED